MKSYAFIIVVVIISQLSSSCIIYSQEYKSGIAVGMSQVTMTEKYQVSFYYPQPVGLKRVQYEREKNYLIYGANYFGSWFIKPSGEIQIKAGLYSSSLEILHRINLGLALKFNFWDDYKAGLGVGADINSAFGDLNRGSNSINSTFDFYLSRRILNNIHLGLSLSMPFDKYYGYHTSGYVNGEYIDGYIKAYADYILKVQLELYL